MKQQDTILCIDIAFLDNNFQKYLLSNNAIDCFKKALIERIELYNKARFQVTKIRSGNKLKPQNALFNELESLNEACKFSRTNS